MLLETLDTKQNDIVIYSQNIFNLDRNFKIIYKDAKLKKPHSISYYEVCNFVNEPSPKVVIAYRLLTNLSNFSLKRSQYGFPMFVDNQPDLVFFDPIFAVKELESLSGVIDLKNLRFRIQQVGLNSLIRKGDKPNFTEIYNFDLSSKEAMTQNDKIFADAIFALDRDFIDSEDAELPPVLPKAPEPEPAQQNAINIDKEYSNKNFQRYVQISNPAAPSPEPPPVNRVNRQPAEPQKTKTDFSSFLEKNKPKETVPTNTVKDTAEKKSMIQIFKSTGQLKEYIHGRNEEPVILKFNK